MSIDKILTVEKRSGLGKGFNRRLRAEQMVPGVFYTSAGENIAIQVPALPLEKMYNEVGRTTVFTIEINDEGKKVSHPAVMWEVQRHPYKNSFTHIDFYGVDLEKPIKVKVFIEFTGVAKGVKLGGRLETYRERVELISKPEQMPKKIIVDVSDMGLNTTLRVADLPVPEGVSVAYDQNFAIVSVISKNAEASEEAE